MFIAENSVIRDYRILHKLGEGGMGTVWLADDTMLDRKVALKVLNPLLTTDPQFTDRFRVEAKVQAKLMHPNIVSLYSFFEESGNYYMAMEYAEGITLKELIKQRGTIPEKNAINIMVKILEGVGYAHQLGIVHRDLKPSNIMVDANDRVKIMDFGIAKVLGDKGMTKTGTKMGTIYYMSPEQIRAEKDIDQRTDIYSLGIVLYEMLTGQLPFNTNTESDFEIMSEIVHGDISKAIEQNRGLSQNTVTVLSKMTMKKKEERFPTCYQCGSVWNNEYKDTSNRIKRSDEFVNIPQKTAAGENKEEERQILHPEKSKVEERRIEPTVKIGSQVWMAENLNVEKFRNGDPIPHAKTNEEWERAGKNKQPAWCYYGNDPANGEKYGKLYNWYTVNDPRGLAPEGWRIPTIYEFETLKASVNNNSNTLKAVGQGTGDGAGTNTSGFSALLAGFRYRRGNFNYLDYFTYFWSSTESDAAYANYLYLSSSHNNIDLRNYYKDYGFSVRCLKSDENNLNIETSKQIIIPELKNENANHENQLQKKSIKLVVLSSVVVMAILVFALMQPDKTVQPDKTTTEQKVRSSTFTDSRDGKIYKTVVIGNQVWMTENLNVDKFRNGDLIPHAKTNEEWQRAGRNRQPAWCYYDNDPANGEKYGKLYNWYAVNDRRGLAPEGWKIPTSDEIEILKASVNHNSNALKAIGQGSGAGAGINTSGFSALLAGYRYFNGDFTSLGYYAGFWGSTEYSAATATYLTLGSNGSTISLFSSSKDYGLSVRCFQD